ncbi:MarP family serine protease [Brevibacterium moorei]|uniref:MarP family serine protease n=1 Tax=Brevibacterium moorei TaxID=2968457 RepID=UPI00211C5324|nr:MarP family serine protease [Brevibacterium sp. 68QC2CO]MCQ9386380.1 MarP family serine protease [Brevibacterium sp. 68QC2CO]
MMLVDWVLVLIALLCAAVGYSQRLTMTLGGLLGFILGLIGGRFLGGWLFGTGHGEGIVDLSDLTGNTSAGLQLAVLAGVPILCGIIVSAIGSWVGALLRESITSRLGRGLDALGGAAGSLLAFALVVWLGAGWIRVSPLVEANRMVAQSQIVATLDRLAPSTSAVALGEIDSVLARNGFPQVFSGQTERIRDVGVPNKGLASVGRRAQDSTVKIVTDQTVCGTLSEGTGWVFKRGYVATNAHVVAGAHRLSVQTGGKGAPYAARVVAFDADTDVAVLYAPQLPAAALSLGQDLRSRADAVVVGYPENGPYTISPARIREQLPARGLDIYGSSTVTRDVYSLRAVVRHGNSGGPLLDARGRVVGMVFAKSATDEDTGYALTLGEVRKHLDATRTTPVDTGSCAAD